MPPEDPTTSNGAARLWLLTGPRHGDNAQLRALAADLGLPAREIPLAYNGLSHLPNGLLGSSLRSLAGPSDGLVPPWPEAVIGIGRRSVPVARWIRAQAGGRMRLVRLGRPRAALGHFDLVLSTPQYAMPDAPGLVCLSLPWQQPMSDPPAQGAGAHVLVVLGGPSWSASPTAATVDALADRAASRAQALGLPVVATTAPRTPPPLAARLRHRLGTGARLYDWAAEGGRGNPYRDDLGLAAETVMTGDSVSMLADAAWTDRPVTVIEPPAPAWLHGIERHGGRAGRAWRHRGGNLALGAPPPDLEAVRDALIASGMAQADGPGAWRLQPCRRALEAERRAALAQLRDLLHRAERPAPGQLSS